jgi:serine/threonine-protein phosphatase 2B catalytic subunit
MSQPATPEAASTTPVPANDVATALNKISTDNIEPLSPIATSTPVSPTSPSSFVSTPFRRGHGRQASLGTTMTSPSTRRRSLESTMSLIKEVYDGRAPLQDTEVEKIADQVAEQTSGKNGAADSGRSSPGEKATSG